MLSITLLAALAALASSLAIPQSSTDGGGITPPFPTNATMTYYDGDASSPCMMPTSQGLWQADFCYSVQFNGLGVPQQPWNDCTFVMYQGSNECGTNAGQTMNMTIPRGNGTVCVDAGVYEPGVEWASGMWSCG